MSSTTAIVAVTPAWNEPAELVALCRSTVAGVADEHYVFEGGVTRLTGGPWRTQAAMRDHGRVWAQEWAISRAGRAHETWVLQLDADEQLVNGELLRPILERWPHDAYPLAYAQEDGSVMLAPFKCFRLPATIVAGCEYVRFAGDPAVYCLAGYSCPDELRAALLELPFVFHTPSRRGGGIRGVSRLGPIETMEDRPPDAVQWPLPRLTLERRVPVTKVDNGGSIVEHEAGDGDYACPGCGARYDTPGVCTGGGESGHEPITVEHVGDDEKPKTKKELVARGDRARARRAEQDGHEPITVEHVGDDEKPKTKKELVAEATELGLDVPSKATVAELEAAIAEHRQAATVE